MKSTATRQSVLVIIIIVLFCESGCDNISAYLGKFSSSQESSEKREEFETPSYEKTPLEDIFESQKALIEEMQYASEYGDKQSIKESYEEFLRLDQKYQEEFKVHEGALLNKEGWEISQMHQQIVKSLPAYSSLMGR